jgi:NADP-dependent aldehyde dehydrogenase
VHQALLTQLEYQVGRIILSQMPTGVEVCASMQHGGPFPSSTDVRSTSVGLAAMQRFLRPLCRQNFPASD